MGLVDSTLLPHNPHAAYVIEHTLVGILIVNEKGFVEYLNPAAEKMFACRLAEVNGKSVDQLIPHLPFCTDRPYTKCEKVALRRDGTTFFAGIGIGSYRDSNGHIYYYVCVTDKGQRSDQIGSTERCHDHYKSLFEHNPYVVFSLDVRGDVSHVNALCETLSGFRADELLRTNALRLIAPEDQDRTREYFARTLKGEPQRYETAMLHKDGRRIRLMVTQIPMVENGSIVGVYGMAEDITEQKRTEEELLATKELLESFINHSTDAINVLDENGNVLRVNRAFETIFGWTEEELKGKPLPIIPPHLWDEYNWIENTVRSGGIISGLETVRQCKDGSYIDVSISVSVIRDSEGRVIGSAAICRDITERKRTAELLRHSEKLSVLGQLAAGIAHEIRNPLTALKGFIQLLQSKGEGNQEYYNIMLSELERINFIVSELLVLAKPKPVDFRPQDLIQMLKNVITLLETQAIINNVQINSSFEAAIPLIHCEENHLKQVFINVLKNAIEAMPNGGTIDIQAERLDANRVLIRFADQGCGIPEERLPRLGEPFYTTKEKGTGLGLMICHRIIEAHRGTFTIHSEVGKGTTVDIVLPVGLEEQSSTKS